MSEDFTTVSPDCRREVLVARLRRRGIDHVYVCGGEGQLLGVVRQGHLTEGSGGRADDWMDRDVSTIDAEAPLSQAITRLLNERQSSLAIMDGESLCGEITLQDLTITLQCLLQIFLRMGQLVPTTPESAESELRAVDALLSRQTAKVRELEQMVLGLKEEEARGIGSEFFDEAQDLLQSNFRLAKRIEQAAHRVEQRMEDLFGLIDNRVDRITGIANQRGLQETLVYQCAIAKRYRRPLSLMLLQLGNSDLSGTCPVGGDFDQHLGTWAVWLDDAVRETDVVARYQDQTFAIVLPDTDREAAQRLCDRLRQDMAEYRLGTFSESLVTAEPGDTATDLLERADGALRAVPPAPRPDGEASRIAIGPHEKTPVASHGGE
jgi:diguanylate cyclase (GGDEF)-like protein